MSVLSSAHAGQTCVVLSPSAGEPKVKTGSSEIMPEKVAPKKEDQKVVPGKDTRSRSPMKVQQKPDKPMKPTIMCQGKPATIVATSQTGGPLYGTEGPDVIVGLGGNDKIYDFGGDGSEDQPGQTNEGYRA